MPNATDRRTDVRVNYQAAATIQTGMRSIQGLCLNLSEGGMLFVGAQVLPIGSRISIRVDLASLGILEAVGEVRRHTETSQGVALGLCFLRLAPRHAASIRRLVAGQVP